MTQPSIEGDLDKAKLLQLHGEVEYREHEIKELEPIRET